MAHKKIKNFARLPRPVIFVSLFALLLGAGLAGFASRPAAATGTPSATTPCVQAAAPAAWKHVVVLMFENKTYGAVIGTSAAPYITSLAQQCGSYNGWKDANTKVTGAADGSYHSKPNYATLTSGVSPSVHGLLDDTYSTTSNVDNIYNQLKIAGKSVKDYYDGPASSAPCATNSFTGAYHDAIRYYTNLGGQSSSPSTFCNTHDVPVSNFMTDVNSGNLPAFSMVLPTNDENMHTGTIQAGDAWAKNFLTPLFNSAQYKSGDTAVFFLWDENTPIPNVLAAPSITPKSTVPTPTGNPISHFSALRTWEDMLGLPFIGDSGKAPSLLSFFNGNGSGPPPQDNPPAVNITAPAAGTTLTSSPTVIKANATDDHGVTKVEFYDGTTLLSTSTTAPYSFSWNISSLSGTHQLTAKAFDTANQSTVSSPINVTVSIPTGCTPPPTTYGVATIVVNAPAGATYHVWSHVSAPDTTNNSYYMAIDGNCAIVTGDSSSLPANTWTWIDYQDGTTTKHITTTLTAGNHTITMTGREPGVKLDRVLLLAGTCTPTDNGQNCADTTPPTTQVTAPTAGQTVGGSVNLTANAADETGGSGVAKVDFLVDGTVVGSDTTAPYSVTWDSTGVTNATHSFTSRATDNAGNQTTSQAVNATVNNTDKIPPTAPTGLTNTGLQPTEVDLQWKGSTDNVAVTGYQVLRNGVTLTTVTTTQYKDTSVVPNTDYSYTVTAVDAAGNISQPSNAVSVTTPNQTGNTQPAAPTGLKVTGVTDTSASLSWTANSDPVVGYYVVRNGVAVGSVTGTSYTDSGLTASTTYSYQLVAFNAAGLNSDPSTTVTATTTAGVDTNPPTAPSNLTGQVVGSQVNLSWSPSTDNVGVTGYRVYRDNTRIATVTATNFGDATVDTTSQHNYYVTAIDAAKNESGKSNVYTSPPAQVKNVTLRFQDNADAVLVQAYPDRNYGAFTSMGVDQNPDRNFLIRFKVSGVNGRTVVSAKLQLWNKNSSTEGGNFHKVYADSWDESKVTWNDSPSGVSNVLTKLGAAGGGQFVYVDLSNYITADGTYSLRADTDIRNGATYSTKEDSTAAHRPVLILQVRSQ